MDVVHAERIAAPHETQEVIHIAASVAVVKRNASGMNAFVLQDCGVTLTGAIGGIGVGAYGNSGRFAGPSGRAQTYFLEGRQLFADDTYFDYTGFDGSAVNSLLDFFCEEIGETRNGAGRHRYTLHFRRKKSLAGTRDHIESGLPRNFLEKANVAPDIVGSQINDGADACGSYEFELIDGLSDQFCSAIRALWPSA